MATMPDHGGMQLVSKTPCLGGKVNRQQPNRCHQRSNTTCRLACPTRTVISPSVSQVMFAEKALANKVQDMSLWSNQLLAAIEPPAEAGR